MVDAANRGAADRLQNNRWIEDCPEMMSAFARNPLAPFAAAALVVSAPVQAAAPAWNVDAGASRLTFSGTHAGKAFRGTFGRWDARINFDPRQLDDSRVIIVVATPSATTGDSVQENALKNAEWFDTGNHPTATFASNDIQARGGDRYVANGTLTMKGRRTPISLPFTVTINGNTARASGTLTLDRARLGLGMQSDPNGDWVSKTIDLNFNLTARRG
jgi:cytochrome b561